MSFWHKTGHILAHIGLGAVQVGLVVGKFIPPPFNLIVSGGAVAASVIIAATHKPVPPAVVAAVTKASQT